MLTGLPTKGNSGSLGLDKPTDGITSDQGLRWNDCGHYTGDTAAPAWWGIDLGSSKQVSKIKLYNRNGCCPERLQGIDLYLGGTWNDPTANALAASKISVPSSMLTIAIGLTGQYLFVFKETARMTLCEIEIWEQVFGSVM